MESPCLAVVLARLSLTQRSWQRLSSLSGPRADTRRFAQNDRADVRMAATALVETATSRTRIEDEVLSLRRGLFALGNSGTVAPSRHCRGPTGRQPRPPLARFVDPPLLSSSLPLGLVCRRTIGGNDSAGHHRKASDLHVVRRTLPKRKYSIATHPDLLYFCQLYAQQPWHQVMFSTEKREA